MKNNIEKKYIVFISLLLGITALFWGIAVLTRGNTLNLYFSSDATNTYMDYFNMLSNIEGMNPYYQNANYPALPFLIWRLLYRMVPWTDSNSDGFFLRNYMPAQLGFILFLLVCIILTWEILKHCTNKSHTCRLFLSISIIFSGPFIFTIERGNIIILAFIFSMLFILLYDSDDKRIRWISYFFLALAAAIKIYPAIFGVLVLSKKRYKESILLLLMGIIFFVAPFYAFDGIESFKTMINGIFLSSSDNLSLGFGYNFSFNNLMRIGFASCGVYKEAIPSLLNLIPFIICSLIYLVNQERWKKVFALTLFIIWIPSFSYTYVLLFIILPLIIFLKEHKSRFDYIYSIFFAIILSPWCLPKISKLSFINGEEFKFYMTYGMLLVNLAILVLSLVLLFQGIYRLGHKLILTKVFKVSSW